jgi:dTDP-3,4-didehydro-2,6-dideoxy-alpha-D-glucose 3-reductase
VIALGVLGCSRHAVVAMLRPSRTVEGLEVRAVASRTAQAARTFARQHGIDAAFDDVQSLLSCTTIDAVYIALPNDLHEPSALAAVRSGKHVLVEKPLALSTAGCRAVLKASEQAGLVVLEGIMVQHHPYQTWVREWLEEPRHGALRRIHTHIALPIDGTRVQRMPSTARGGGVLRDIAPYWLQFLQVAGSLCSVDVDVRLHVDKGARDVIATARLIMQTGLEATLSADYFGPFRATHVLTRENASLRVENIFRANIGPACIHMTVTEKGKSPTRVEIGPAYAFARQAQAFRDLILGTDSARQWLSRAALERQEMTDRLFDCAKLTHL